MEAGESLFVGDRVCSAGRCLPGPCRAGCAGAAGSTPGRNSPGSRSGCPQQAVQLSGAVPHSIPVARPWLALPWVLLTQSSCGCFHGPFPSVGRTPVVGQGLELGGDEGIWATLGFSQPSCWATRAFPGRGWRLPVSPLSLSVGSGENTAGGEAGAKHVTGRTLLPIKLQTVSQEIAFLRWSCFSQAFGLLLFFWETDLS